MLTRLRLQAFKSWKDTGDVALKPVTGFFGPNSSGKTSLIQALLLLKQTADSPDRGLVFHFGSEKTPADLGEMIGRGRGRSKLTLEQYVAQWLKDLGLIHDFRVESLTKGSPVFEVRVRRSETAPEVLLTDVGFGVSQILPVLVLCFYVPPGATIILEQPEIHLHPAVQSGLADVLIDAWSKRGVQILLESHSEHLLRRLQRRVAEQKVSKDDVGLYFCSTSGGGSKIMPLDLDVMGNIRNWPEGFFGDDFGEIAAMSRAARQRRREGAA